MSEASAAAATSESRHLSLTPRSVLRWLLILTLVAGANGTACAFFLWSLDAVTRFRFAHPCLLALLPAGGAAIGWLYHRFGKSAEAGNNLLMDRIHEPGAGVPRRMAPLILIGTLATHLFGGSAGREGTAVQMGGSIAAAVCRWFRCDAQMVRIILMTGIAAGFAAVFGTPIAGAVFAVEVLTIGRLEWRALPVCLGCAIAADFTCRAWGATHTHYHVNGVFGGGLILQHWSLTPKIIVVAIACGLTARLFAWASHRLAAWSKKRLHHPMLRPAVGGIAVIALFFMCGKPDYLGLGVLAEHPGALTLPSFFGTVPAPATAWLWKLAFTVVTLGFGFKGGEVTPLFFIGAALGSALAGAVGAPPELLAALGFVAIFSGATNTPVACTLMGMELFGPGLALPLALACFTAYLCSGPQGIYSAQRPGNGKPRFTFKRFSSQR